MTDSPTLTLRGLQGDDWIALYPLLTRHDILQDGFDMPYMSEESFRDRVSNPPAHVHTLVANITLASGRERVVGVVWVEVMVNRRRHVGRIQWVVHPDFYGTPVLDGVLQAAIDLADNWLGLRRLEAVVFAEDAVRLPVLERHGFVREATMQRYALRRGQLAPAALLARLHPGRDLAHENSTDREIGA